MKQIKVALVYDAIYPYVKGGAERRYFEIGKRLANRNYEVHLYGMKFWKGPDVIYKDGLFLHGICKEMPLYTKKGRRSILQALYFGINCLKLIKEDFDIIDCCGFPYFSLFSCKIVCLQKGKKLYSTWHEVWGRKYWREYLGILGIFGEYVEKIAAILPDSIITVSPSTAIRVRKELKVRRNVTVIPNGIDFETIQKAKPSNETSDLMYAGRLMDFKNVDLLIGAVKILTKVKKDVKCLIIGNGPEEQNLKKLTKELGLEANIMFKGFAENATSIYSYLKSSKVLVLPSVREGFGIIALEANASGIPFVTVDSDSNASKDLVLKGNANGRVVRLSEKDIASDVFDLLDRVPNRKVILDFARSYDWNKISSNYLNLITK